MKEFEIVYERRETYREVFKVSAESEEEALELAEEMNCEHDWTENEVIYGDEQPIQVREVE